MTENITVDRARHAAEPTRATVAALSERQGPKLIFSLIFAALAWMAAAPFLMLVYSSFTSDKDQLPFETTSVSFVNYLQILQDPKTWEVLGTTALFTVGATSIGIGVAMFLAWVIERTDVPLRRFLFVATLIPMAIPA